jgi:three-Cys-motif partner protein
MKEDQFFEKQTNSSRVKASIVSEYFPSYCKIIVRKNIPKEIRYIDLFAGPGVYQDGNPSTPILIGRHCKADSFLCQNVKMVFNDNMYHAALERNFLNEFPDGTFVKKPHFGKGTVGENAEITKFLIKPTHAGTINESPSVLFIDPFGYKGIETRVLAEFLKNWGNEIFLFVNTKRIHPALENDKFEGLMNDLFPTTLQKIKSDRRFKSSVAEKLSLIIDSLGSEYESILGGKIYYTAFKFQEEDIDATSHYILHITKGVKGYELIKAIYNDFANVGTVFDGVNTYTFDAKKFNNPAVELFDLNSLNIDKLKDELFSAYRGRELTALNLYLEHHPKTLYCHNHYTQALRRLVDEQKVSSTFTDNKQHIKSVLIMDQCVLNFN